MNHRIYSEESGEVEEYEVTHTWVHDDDTIVTLTIDGEIIETTPWHPFFTDEGWEDAGDLEVGDLILSLDGDYGMVDAVLVEDRTETMYNLTVDEAHTFYVGDGEWLVHNCPDFSNIATELETILSNPAVHPTTGIFPSPSPERAFGRGVARSAGVRAE